MRLTDALRKICDDADNYWKAQQLIVNVATEAVYLAELVSMAFESDPLTSTFARLEFSEWCSEDRESMNIGMGIR